jgi:hypothetical protein
VHASHSDILGIFLPQIGRKKEPADSDCRVGLANQLNEFGEPDMLVRSISFQHLLPKSHESRISKAVVLAVELHLLSEDFVEHFLEAVLDDVVSGIERNATATSPSLRLSLRWYCLPLV